MTSRFSKAILWSLLAASLAPADTIVATYNPAGQQTASASSVCAGAAQCILGTNDFNSWTGGSLVTDFGTGGEITGSYSGGMLAYNADQYGGAGGTGRYAVTYQSSGAYSLSLSTEGVPGVNYFGFWFSALDAGNLLQFYNKGNLLYSFTPAAFTSLVGTCNGNNAFCGNPNAAFAGQDSGEQFAFLNFFDTGGTFDQVTFSETGGGGFESDNQTVGYIKSGAPSGTVISASPEPDSALLGLAGLGLIAFSFIMRRGRSSRY